MNRNLRLHILLAAVVSLCTASCKKDDNGGPSKAINLYFSCYDNNSVSKIDLVNTPNDFTVLFNHADSLSSPEGIAFTKDKYLIVTEENTDRILKMNKNGNGEITVLYDVNDGVSTPTAVAVDNSNGTIYWCNSGTGQVYKGSEDGLTPAVAMYNGESVLEYAFGIALDKKHNKLYISDFYEYIKVGNLDGSSSPESLWDKNKYPDLLAPSNIFVLPDRKKIYWSDEVSDQIIEANLDGTGTPTVLFDASDGVDRPDGVFVDAADKKIYWSETIGAVIARGNLDGTGGREVLISGMVSYSIILE